VIPTVSAAEAAQVAKDFLAMKSGVDPRMLGLVDHDQWTVSGEFRALRPLYRFDLGDRAATQLYISSVTGRAVQVTTSRERFWNWLGAIPHWLYFSELRRNAALWRQVIIGTSLLGCFLTVIGIYLGLRRALALPRGSWSPYEGINLWHHVAGLFFGVFALSWTASGLFSMNPWGLLEGQDGQREFSRIHGARLSTADLNGALQTLAGSHPAAVTVESAALNDRIFFIARPPAGEPRRLDAAGSPAPLSRAELDFIAAATDGAHPGSAPELLRHEDEFYFSHHREIAALPIYRLMAANGTRYYFDAVSGMPVAKRDAQAQAYRWLHEGLHRMDFAAALRGRPQWDILMLTLMTGLTVVCITGAYLGLRRLTR
jgi:hypothetical protein